MAGKLLGAKIVVFEICKTSFKPNVLVFPLSLKSGWCPKGPFMMLCIFV